MKYAEIYLDYFKRGDDLNYHLEKQVSPHLALEAHALQMEDVARHLRAIAEEIKNYSEDIDIQADTHHIGISGPDELIDRLIELELAEEDEFEESELEEAELD